MSRPTKLTPRLQARICELIAGGNYIAVSCQAVGINYETFRQWCIRGHEGIEPFIGFLVAVQKSVAEAEAKHLRIIEDASHTTWQAAAWILERRHPERWARKDRVLMDASESLETDPVNLFLNVLHRQSFGRMEAPALWGEDPEYDQPALEAECAEDGSSTDNRQPSTFDV